MYWREYRTEAHIAETYGASEATVCRTIHAVENALLRSGCLRLPGKKALTQSQIPCQVVVVDATECPVERPQKTAALLQRQEEAPHAESANSRKPKDQADPSDRVQRGQDARLQAFKNSRTALPPETECLADSGYLGLTKCHENSRLPHKKSKLHPLTNEQKAQNRQLARERFVAEHIIRSLKAFRILSQPYRNRRKRFGLRFNLIAAIYNYELTR